MDELLDDARASPDDDAPRLVWADAVGGERGELVVIQCDLARGDLPPDGVAARKRRQRELLERHGREWSGLAGIATRCTFSRGFVEAADIDVEVFLRRGDDIVRGAPMLSAVTVSGLVGYVDYTGGVPYREGPDALALLARLFATPCYSRFRGLEITSAGVRARRDADAIGYHFNGLGDDVIDLMLAKRAFARLRAFGIGGSSTSSYGVREMCARNVLGSIERLWIRDYPGTEAVIELLEHAPKLAALDLGAQIKHVKVLPKLPTTVVELRVIGVTDETLDLLADRAPQLERLSLHHGELRHRASAFARFPRLRSLDLRDVRFGSPKSVKAHRAVLESFLSLRMPALRELSCPSPISPDEVRAMIAVFGPHLDLIDVSGDYKVEAVAERLQEGMPGELRVGGWGGNHHPLHVGGRTTEPWLDRATIVV